MDSIPGFVKVPRLPETARPSGAFFSAKVISEASGKTWLLQTSSGTLQVTSSVPLTVGSTIQLVWTEKVGKNWIARILPSPTPLETRAVGSDIAPGLVGAFVRAGLPLVAEQLQRWQKWLSGHPGLPGAEDWAAGLQGRDALPGSAWDQNLQTWLGWIGALPMGADSQPPEDDDFWDLWNSVPTKGTGRWIIHVLRWEYQGHQDSGLLTAHWDSIRQQIDQWSLAAAPAHTPFQLRVTPSQDALHVKWYFLHKADADYWSKAVISQDFGHNLGVKLTVEVFHGEPENETCPPKGIDVEA